MRVLATSNDPVRLSFLTALLADAGIVTNPAVKNAVLRYYLLATGSDRYEAAFSLGELDPKFGGAGAPDLIAYLENGAPLGPDGFARVVVPGDDFGGRYVSNLVSLQVLDAVPEPASLLLLAVGVFGLTMMRLRRSVAAPRSGGPA